MPWSQLPGRRAWLVFEHGALNGHLWLHGLGWLDTGKGLGASAPLLTVGWLIKPMGVSLWGLTAWTNCFDLAPGSSGDHGATPRGRLDGPPV